jgi:C1A family cysteine protease
LFVYYNIRKTYNETESDSGGYLRDGVKSVQNEGICSEKLWPYDINKFSVEPDKICYEDGQKRLLKNYRRLTKINDILDALNNNIPVVFGTEIFVDFYDLNQHNYVISLPKENQDSKGGHAMCFVGYDLEKKLLLVKNSFGTEWGDAGYCWMPFDYFNEYCYDIWIFDLDLK